METEKDYKKMYLEQKKQSLILEMNLIQMRAAAIQAEMPGIEEKLKKHADKNKVPGKDKT